ncbi:MAG: HAMP domain-containing histidine kinase [Lentisphaeraceae bacterium]|nr:HAMP domain-containing histidine kinase [Lentisphaeraceae bacterium]
MKPRLIFLFTLIVLIPMTTIIWLGISLSLRERTVVKEQFRQICVSNLKDIKSNITSKIEALELKFDNSNKGITTFNIQSKTPEDPLINQLFILNSERKLEYPNPNSLSLSKAEKGFLSRTEEIWQSGETFYRPQEYQEVALQNERAAQSDDLPNQYVDVQQQTSEPQVEQQIVLKGNRNRSYINTLNVKPLVESTTGWYSWFQGKGLNFILWKRNEMDQIIGYELNRDKMIEAVIETLPKSTTNKSQHFQLNNATGILHCWGDFQPTAELQPIAELSLSAPLQSWKLYCYFNDSHLAMASSKTILYNYVLGGSILGILIAILCIYFYRENSRQLRESSEKVNFVNQVSHELKTPLTNIRMYAELLDRNLSEENAKAQKQLGVIVSESQRLSRLISNVLSFAQKDKKTLKLNIRKVELGPFLQNVVNYYTPVLERKNIKISLETESNLDLQADSDALEQIFGNLFSNVEKYVPQNGEVRVNSKQEQNFILISVCDNGPGIPTKQREKIFDSFHRVSNELSDGISGTGIGLTISRDLARLHGGDLILLDSEKGASFQLSLPINKAEGK